MRPTFEDLPEMLERALQEIAELRKEVRAFRGIPSEKKHVYGIGGLADLLGCSKPTAQKIKDSGKAPFTQVGRKIIFDADEVLRSLGKRRGGK